MADERSVRGWCGGRLNYFAAILGDSNAGCLRLGPGKQTKRIKPRTGVEKIFLFVGANPDQVGFQLAVVLPLGNENFHVSGRGINFICLKTCRSNEANKKKIDVTIAAITVPKD